MIEKYNDIMNDYLADYQDMDRGGVTKSELDFVLSKYDYGYRIHVKDDMGRKWAFQSFPISSGGTTNYFKTLTDFKNWIRQVILNRAAENDISQYDLIIERKRIIQLVIYNPSWADSLLPLPI